MSAAGGSQGSGGDGDDPRAGGAAGAGDAQSSTDDGAAEDAPPKPSNPALKSKLTQARATLLMRYPFFGYLVTHLEDKTGTEWMQTAGTDGTNLFWSDEFLERIAPQDVVFVMAHEAMHCALQHLWRRGEREPRKWNLACDAAVNDMLLEAGLTTALPMIRGANGRAAEEVYESIEDLIRANGGRGTLDDHGRWIEGKAGDPQWRAASDAWRAALQQAKSYGNVPGGMNRHIDGVLNPRRDWRDLLREGLFSPEDYSWKPTDRRFSQVLLPTLAGEVHRVVIAVDTSGSIQGDKLKSFWAELVAILRNNRCEARVLACDADVQNEWDEAQFDPSLIDQVKGGGGTNFVPVFDRVERYIQQGWRPEAVVYLTDLDGHFPQRAPEVRTLWVVGKDDARKRAPFGEVIPVDF
jgi:predicted metal-dependent peptidase